MAANKQAVAAILGAMGKTEGPGAPAGANPSAGPMGDLTTAAQDVLDAIHGDDAQALAGALSAFVDMKQGTPPPPADNGG